MPSRSLDDLLPGTKRKYLAWKEDAESRIKQRIFETCTFRLQSEQDALYAQGRTTPGAKVTWTRQSLHSKRRAVDFALKMPNPWDVKADVDLDGIADYREVGLLAAKHGLQWGVRLKDGTHTDICHLQDNEIYEEA